MPRQTNFNEILRQGLWHNNPALVATLGLCPLLAVTNTVVNSFALGIATTLTLIGSSAIVSAFRRRIPDEVRLPVFVMIIASLVTIIELCMRAYYYELYEILGIFVPLIVTNCAIIGRAEAFAKNNSLGLSIIDGLATGLGFTLALLALGGLRELLGSGTLLADAALIFGDIGTTWKINVNDDYPGFLLAILPPGAFIGLGLIVALKNTVDIHNQARFKRGLQSDGFL